jgi:hypothetical protein
MKPNPAVERTCAKSRAGRSLLRWAFATLVCHERSKMQISRTYELNPDALFQSTLLTLIDIGASIQKKDENLRLIRAKYKGKLMSGFLSGTSVCRLEIQITSSNDKHSDISVTSNGLNILGFVAPGQSNEENESMLSVFFGSFNRLVKNMANSQN